MSERQRLFLVEEPSTLSVVPPHEEQSIPDWKPEISNPTPDELPIVINTARVDEVLGTLLTAYSEKRYPYNQDNVRLPHDPRHMPETLELGSKAHAMLLWNVCYYMRGGIKSVDAFKRMSALYDKRPELYDASAAANIAPEEIATEVKTHGLGFQKTVGKQWVENAKRLAERYDGDPRNIFADITSYDECLERIKNQSGGRGFIGFQEKMASMITYYLMDEGMIEPFMFPIPVDLHVLRVSIANQMVTFPGVELGTNVYTPELLATLRKLYVDYATDKGVNPLRLCDAVWLLSESSCGKNPGNVTTEPLGRANRNGRATVLVPQEIDTANPRQQAAYDASCRECPLEPTCEYNIPGKQYYVSGSLMIRGERVRFPVQEPAQTKLFLAN